MKIIDQPSPAVTDLTVVAYCQGRFLIQQRSVRNPKNGRLPRYPAYCCFPGEGLKEAGGVRETMNEAVRRWGQDEYGVEVELDSVEFLFQYEHDDKPDVDNVVLWVIGDDQNFILKEGAAFHWVAWDELAKLPLGFEQAEILPRIKAELDSRGLELAAAA